MSATKTSKSKNTARRVATISVEECVNEVFSAENTAMILMRTKMENYKLAMLLNDAFGLKLARTGTICVNGDVYLFFHYCDEIRRIDYLTFNIRRSLNRKGRSALSPCDNLFLIRGRDIWSIQQEIYEEMVWGARAESLRVENGAENSSVQTQRTTPLFTPNIDLHNSCIKALHQEIFGIESFSFSNKRGLVTSLCPMGIENTSKETAIYVDSMQKFFDDVLYRLNVATYEAEDRVVFYAEEKNTFKLERKLKIEENKDGIKLVTSD